MCLKETNTENYSIVYISKSLICWFDDMVDHQTQYYWKTNMKKRLIWIKSSREFKKQRSKPKIIYGLCS